MTCEFVRMELKNNLAASATLEGHREIIQEYAEKGFSYTGFVPVSFGPSGKLLVIDLVFQK